MKKFLMLFLVGSALSADPWKQVTFTRPARILSLYQMMKDMHELFEKHAIPYWIDAGTLLGAVRHTGIIPWDNDIDVCIEQRYKNAILGMKNELKPLGYTIEEAPFGLKIRSKRGFFDIFFVQQKKHRIFYADKATQCYFALRDNGPIYISEDELYPLKKYTFGALRVWGPNDPTAYLNNYFKGWATKARFLRDHVHYDSLTITLTDKDKVPAEPQGPLEDRVS